MPEKVVLETLITVGNSTADHDKTAEETIEDPKQSEYTEISEQLN